MRVAGYIRVSTNEQAEKGNSLFEQKERQEAYCRAMGWETPVFFIDDGYSAKDMNRPDAQKLISLVKENQFDIVLTTKLDRMSRNLLDMLQLIKLLGEHECNYVSASEGFDTSTPVGRMVLQMLASFAEFERERIAERVADNMTSLAKNTDMALYPPCFGYLISDEGKYAINTEEAEIVELMAQQFEQGHGYRMVAKILNDNEYTTKKGFQWDQVNVKRLIRNEMLEGTMIYNKRKSKNGKTVMRPKSEWIIKENNHPAIIEPERFRKLIEILDSRKPAGKHADSETYLLTGIVKCGHCNRNMKGNTARYNRPNNKSYAYYRYVCSSYSLGYGCKHHTVHRDDLEQEIIQTLEKIANASTKELKELNLTFAPSSKVSDEIEILKNQLAKIDKRMQKQIEAYTNDLISAADLKLASDRVEKERNEVKLKLERQTEQKTETKGFKEQVSKLIPIITGEDRVKAKAAIRQIIDRFEVFDGEKVRFIWKPLV